MRRSSGPFTGCSVLSATAAVCPPPSSEAADRHRVLRPRVSTVRLWDGARFVWLSCGHRGAPAFEDRFEVLGAHQLDVLIRVAIGEDRLDAVAVEDD